MLVLNDSLFRNVTLVSHWASRSALFADILQPRACAHRALSGSSWTDTPSYRNVLYPRGAVQLLETMAIALDRRVVRLCRHLSKNMNCEAERYRAISWRFSSSKTANSRVFCRHTHIYIYRRTQTLNPPLRIGAPGNNMHDTYSHYRLHACIILYDCIAFVV